eukprot:2327272-Pyramimonas_sp.AAC.1
MAATCRSAPIQLSGELAAFTEQKGASLRMHVKKKRLSQSTPTCYITIEKPHLPLTAKAQLVAPAEPRP